MSKPDDYDSIMEEVKKHPEAIRLLADERENHEERYETQEEHHLSENRAFRGEIQQLRAQLADAEAKIQATLKLPSTTVDGVGYIRASRVERLLANTDTTALDAAIAAAQQPLVDALTGARPIAALNASSGLLELIDAALAKVKEGK